VDRNCNNAYQATFDSLSSCRFEIGCKKAGKSLDLRVFHQPAKDPIGNFTSPVVLPKIFLFRCQKPPVIRRLPKTLIPDQIRAISGPDKEWSKSK
jgi:hypothetical protein